MCDFCCLIAYLMLLLPRYSQGAGESGKSTLFKQMITIYGKGFSVDDRKNYRTIVNNNIITSMKVLCSQVSIPGKYGSVLPENEHALNAILSETKEDSIDEEKGKFIKALWADPAIQNAYEHRSEFQLTDSAAYFFGRIDEVVKPDYIPNQQDVLRSRVRTTGIVENEFEIDGNQFKMYDVGGQRNERKKWIHCFEEVTAVIFVAAMSEYDQKLYEDENTNRMTEALNLFEEICNSRWFRETSMILFLNKCDAFKEKIVKVRLGAFFPEFPGPDYDYDSAQAWIQSQFESKNHNPKKRVYSHVTCATETKNVAYVFNTVKDIIITNSLRGAGLLQA